MAPAHARCGTPTPPTHGSSESQQRLPQQQLLRVGQAEVEVEVEDAQRALLRMQLRAHSCTELLPSQQPHHGRAQPLSPSSHSQPQQPSQPGQVPLSPQPQPPQLPPKLGFVSASASAAAGPGSCYSPGSVRAGRALSSSTTGLCTGMTAVAPTSPGPASSADPAGLSPPPRVLLPPSPGAARGATSPGPGASTAFAGHEGPAAVPRQPDPRLDPPQQSLDSASSLVLGDLPLIPIWWDSVEFPAQDKSGAGIRAGCATAPPTALRRPPPPPLQLGSPTGAPPVLGPPPVVSRTGRRRSVVDAPSPLGRASGGDLPSPVTRLLQRTGSEQSGAGSSTTHGGSGGGSSTGRFQGGLSSPVLGASARAAASGGTSPGAPPLSPTPSPSAAAQAIGGGRPHIMSPTFASANHRRIPHRTRSVVGQMAERITEERKAAAAAAAAAAVLQPSVADVAAAVTAAATRGYSQQHQSGAADGATASGAPGPWCYSSPDRSRSSLGGTGSQFGMGGAGTGVGLSSGAAGGAAMGISCCSDGGNRSAAGSPQTFIAPPLMPPSAAAAAAAAAAPTAVPELLHHMLHTRSAVLGQQLPAGAGACESANSMSDWHEYSEPAAERREHLLHNTADAGSAGAESSDDDAGLAGLSSDYLYPRSSLRRQQPLQHTPQQLQPLLQASQSSRSFRAEQQQLQPQQLQPQRLQPQQLQPQSASSPNQPRAPVVPKLRLPASTAASPQQTLTHAASAASLGNGSFSDDNRGRLMVVNDVVAQIVEQHDAATAAAAAAAAKLAPTRLTYSGSAAKALPVLTDADGMNGYLEELLLPPAHTGAAQLQQRRRTTPLRLATLPPPPSPPDTARTRGLKATVATAMATMAAAAALEEQWSEEAQRGGEGGSCRDAGPGAGRGSQQQSRSASVQGLGQGQQGQGPLGGEASRLRLPEALVREVVSRGRGRS